MKIGASVIFFAALAATTFAKQEAGPLARLSMSGPPALARATPLTAVEPTRVLHLSVALKYADPAGIRAFVDDVSNPLSPNYRHFLSPFQIGQKFGQSNESVQAMASYLADKGMTVKLVSKSHLSILVDATAAQAETAFHTKLSYFASDEVARVKKGSLFGYTVKPSVPAELAPMVETVGGLENFTQPKTHDWQFESPDQLRQAYGVAPSYAAGFKGLNRTVAITSYDGFDLGNIPPEYQQFNLPTPAGGIGSNVTVKTVNASNPGQSSTANGEGDLDIQCVLNVAPLCTLLIYDGGPLNNADPISTLTLEQEDNLADVVTTSYGFGASSDFYSACNNLYVAMNAQGMTNMAASGDHGAPGVQDSPYPAMDPEVLSVGGTTIHTDDAGNRQTETAWSLTYELGGTTTAWGGAGGWYPSSDAFNVLPTYQKGTGIPTNVPYRLIPDIALDADFSYEVFENETFLPSEGYYVGGTSAASPTFASSLADIEGRLVSGGLISADSHGHYRLGRVQDLLYKQNGNSSVFYDITSGQIGTLPDGTTANAGTGWDFCTGLGVVNFNGLYNLFTTTSGTVSALSVSPNSVEGGSTSTVNGTVTLSASASSPVGVNLTSSDTSVKVPASVTVPAGSKTVNFSVTTLSVSATKTVTVTAKSGTSTATSTITLTPPHATNVSISPLSVVGGAPATGTVTIAEGAPTGGTVVTLTSASSAVAKVPATVTIAAGQTKTNFTITTTAVATNTPVVITAAAGGKSPTGTVTVTAATLSTLKMSSSSFLAGQAAIGTVNLTGVAPTGGITVTISLSNPALMTISSTSVSVPAGSATGSFRLTANPVDTSSAETITATLNGVTRTTSLAINPARLTAVTSSATSVLGGNSATIGFTLDSPAGPSGISVKISATPTSAAAFSGTTVTIAPGSSSTTAVLKTMGVSTNTAVTVSGTAVATKSVQITVTAPVLQAFTISPSSIQGNGSNKVTAKITLSGTTGSSPRTITLASSSGIANFPSSIVVPANSSSVSFTFAPSAVTQSNLSVTLTATLGNTALQQTLTITP